MKSQKFSGSFLKTAPIGRDIIMRSTRNICWRECHLIVCTHEGSGMGHSEKDIAKARPNATVLEGITIHGTSANSADSKVSSWIDKLGISL